MDATTARTVAPAHLSSVAPRVAAVPAVNEPPAAETYDLATLPQTVRDTLEDELAPATKRAYRQAWRGWVAWCETSGAIDLPASPVDVAEFVVDLARAGRALATIRLAVAGIDAHHRVVEMYGGYGGTAPADVAAGKLAAPGGSGLVRRTLRGLKKRAEGLPGKSPAPGPGRGQAAPLTAKLLAWIDRSAAEPRLRGPRGRRETPALAARRATVDRAIAWTLYDGMLRRNELAALTGRDLTPAADGGAVAFIRRAKSDARHVYLRPATARALARALAALPPAPADAPLLGLSAASINRRLQAAVATAVAASAAAAVAAGLPPEAADLPAREVKGVSGHSGRVGMVQALTRAGHSNSAIMQAGGWKSAEMVARYAARIDPETGAVATAARSGQV